MAVKYSAEWVKEMARGKTWLDHHRCALCNSMVGYIIADDLVYFQSECGCSWSPPRLSSFDEIAHNLAQQFSDELRDRIVEGLR